MMRSDHEPARAISRAESNMLAAWDAKSKADEKLAARVSAAFPVGRQFMLRTERNRQYYWLPMRVINGPSIWHDPGTLRAVNERTLKARSVNVPWSLSRGEIT